jgi:hypothetical protein
MSHDAGEPTVDAAVTVKRRNPRRYALSALGLVAIIAAAALVQSVPHPRVVRPPVEFLPASTRAAIVIDVRPDSSAGRQLREAWSASDIEHLGGRAADLSQELANWTGLQLDLRKDVAPWFGGEVAVGSVGLTNEHGLSARSVVVIARATSLRRARASLDRAVAAMADKLEWKRFTAKRPGGYIIVWRDPVREDHIAYANRDGCLLVSASLKVIEQCLVAVDSPKDRLLNARSFQQTFSRLPKHPVVWAYLDVGYMSQGTRFLLPALRRGWGGVVREFVHGFSRGGESRRRRDLGGLAIALSPDREGVRLKAAYAPERAPSEKASPTRLEQLASLLPQTTEGYMLVHEPRRFLPLSSGDARGRIASRAAPLPLALLRPDAWINDLPDNLLVALVPEPGKGELAVLVAAPSEEMIGSARLFLASAVPHAVSGEVDHFFLVAGSEDALRQARLAVEDGKQRLAPARGRDCEFEVWAQPARLSAAASQIEEFRLRGWMLLAGGEGELILKTTPRSLLGEG